MGPLREQARSYFGVSVAVLFFAGGLPPAHAQALERLAATNPDVAAGDRIAHALCANCHVVDADSPVVRKDRVPSFFWIAHEDNVNEASMTTWFTTSHERMPDLVLNREEVRQITAYILSLRDR